MTGRIINLRGDRCQHIQRLLPWHAAGALDADEQAEVAAHLAVCPECQAEARFDQRLRAEFVGLPIELGQDWAAMRRRIAEGRGGGLRELVGRRRPGGWRAAVPWLGWAVAASLAAAIAVGWFPERSGRYHALGARSQPASGNLVVIFRPDAGEAAMRRMLLDNHLRLVDGPTAADAYVLRAPPAERAGALARLRAEREVSLAEPIDGPPSP